MPRLTASVVPELITWLAPEKVTVAAVPLSMPATTILPPSAALPSVRLPDSVTEPPVSSWIETAAPVPLLATVPA